MNADNPDILNSSETFTNLAKAMLKVQSACTPAVKDAENPFVKNKYATLASVMDACRNALTENGVWLTQYPMPSSDGHIGIVTKLVHAESGEWQTSVLNMPLAKNDPQGVGSALTYGRRYAICTILGIVTEDDDGNAASCTSSNRQQILNQSQQRPPQQQRTQQAPPQEQAPATAATDPCAKLPRLDGVNFNAVTATNGRICITATGNTQTKADMLKQTGFCWNATRKIWWMYAA